MSEEIFHCLTIRQPWAWAIVSGAKGIENRSWKTDYRGPLVIHSGAAKTVVNQFIKAGGTALPTMSFDYGSLIGVVDLVDIVPLSEKLESNPWAWGPYCWVVENPRRFIEAIPAKGKLKLYTLPASPGLRAAVESARAPQPDLNASAWIKTIAEPDSAEVRFDGLFLNYMDLPDVESLMRLAQDALAKRADSDAFTYRAVAYEMAQEHESALSDASRAIALDPQNQRALLMRSNIYRALGKRALAAQDRRKAEELGKSLANLPASQDDEPE